MAASILTPTQRYAAGGLLSLSLHQAQTHQTQLPQQQHRITNSTGDSVSDDPQLWVHHSSHLLRPIFRFLEIDEQAWLGLEETSITSSVNHHAESFLMLLAEERGDTSSEMKDQEHALSKAVDHMSSSIESSTNLSSKKEHHREYEQACRDKFSDAVQPQLKVKDDEPLNQQDAEVTPEVGENLKRRRNGYDARHRVALRLLSTWFSIEWNKMEAIETIVATSAMAILKEAEAKQEEGETPKSKWAKWKRGGIIGAAAVTGGTLMAITGGLAAPAIAAGFGALAPTLGTIIPVIGASGFAAAATAAGSVAGSVAVAASFGAAGAGLTGTKMARRTGSINEFEFKAIGENHNQGRLAVEMLISGFVFEEEDFVRPWEGQTDNSERYALQWESKHLIAVSTAIQDWLKSRLAMTLMQQGAMMTVLSSLLTALVWPAALLTLTDFIDSKWSIAVDRSDKAGILLAEEVLLKGLQGHRPVTLIGFSLGARVIFKCLQILSKSEKNAGLVERVVLLGSPIAIKDENWEAVRKIVSGRFVNAYSTDDWTLGVAFRASLLSRGLAGIQPVDVPGIENVDVTEMTEGHSSYLWATQHILEQLELDSYYPVFNATSMKPGKDSSSS
ncbi:transmembrane and coiled-coil domain-containing protein STS1-like isoform X2 [Apium graveolens]|uniref:transmembrane and coiled-coil domain-containing protein STS1-like isoform X2 n=1 Tax=Apium graveolens TaxID=4045 RepID=UPI003D78E46D